MTITIPCPKCNHEVPLHESPVGPYTCPECQAEFRLEVVLVEPSPSQEKGKDQAEEETSGLEEVSAAASSEGAVAASTAVQQPPSEAESAAAPEAEEEPLGGETPPSSELAEVEEAPREEKLSTESETALAEQETADETPPEKTPVAEEASQEEETPEEETLVGTVGEDQDEEFWDTLAQQAQAEEESLTEKALALSQHQGPSPLVHLVGLVVSGFLGLAIGYYLLNYFGGPRFNFLKIPLPGVPHTQNMPEESFRNFLPFPLPHTWEPPISFSATGEAMPCAGTKPKKAFPDRQAQLGLKQTGTSPLIGKPPGGKFEAKSELGF